MVGTVVVVVVVVVVGTVSAALAPGGVDGGPAAVPGAVVATVGAGGTGSVSRPGTWARVDATATVVVAASTFTVPDAPGIVDELPAGTTTGTSLVRAGATGLSIAPRPGPIDVATTARIAPAATPPNR